MIDSTSKKILTSALVKILCPLVRILLHNGISYGAFVDIVKKVYIDIATNEFMVAGKRQTVSRVATITGLSRKEVQRVNNIEQHDESEQIKRYNRAARVVYGWVHDPKYSAAPHQTAILPFDGAQKSFSLLVKEHSGDMPPHAILDELLQAGVVACDQHKNISLLERAYIPKTANEDKLRILGMDVSGLLNTINHNIYHSQEKPLFQRKVYYDNLPSECLPELQTLLAEHGQSLLEFLDQWMAKRDRDINPNVKGSGRKAAGIGLFYFENTLPQGFQP